jgi:putative iron-dependent peroxidase
MIGIHAVKLTAKDPSSTVCSLAETSSRSASRRIPVTTAAPQPGVFVEGSHAHWFGHFDLPRVGEAEAIRAALSQVTEAATRLEVNVVFGFSAEAWALLRPGQRIEGLRPLLPIAGARAMVATQSDVFIWLHSNAADRNLAVLLGARRALGGSLVRRRETLGQVHLDSRDLSGFIDGTENVKGDERFAAAQIRGGVADGASFVLTQKWVHDLDRIESLEMSEQEAMIGRTKPDSVELAEVPPTSHLGRVVIQDADGEELAIYRRSVPFGTLGEHGLYFTAFTNDLDVMQRMLDQMFGATEDGIVDRVTDYSTPVSGAYYFVPAQAELTEALRH